METQRIELLLSDLTFWVRFFALMYLTLWAVLFGIFLVLFERSNRNNPLRQLFAEQESGEKGAPKLRGVIAAPLAAVLLTVFFSTGCPWQQSVREQVINHLERVPAALPALNLDPEDTAKAQQIFNVILPKAKAWDGGRDGWLLIVQAWQELEQQGVFKIKNQKLKGLFDFTALILGVPAPAPPGMKALPTTAASPPNITKEQLKQLERLIDAIEKGE